MLVIAQFYYEYLVIAHLLYLCSCHGYIIGNRDGIGISNLRLSCAFCFYVYCLHVTTKRLTELTLCACAVFVPSLRAEAFHSRVHRMDCTGWHSARCQHGALSLHLLKHLDYSQDVTTTTSEKPLLVHRVILKQFSWLFDGACKGFFILIKLHKCT